MMSMLMIAFVGHTMSGDESPARERREQKDDDPSSN
jgi:hypothetical protein